MKPPDSWRIDAARSLVEHYADQPGVVAAFVVGSAAKGYDDEWSDLDLVVVWDEPDRGFLEGAPLVDAGAERFTFAPSDAGAVEQYMVGTLKVDVASMRRADLETLVDDVVERADTEWAKHKVVEGVLDAVPLVGDDIVEDLRVRAARYPDELATAVARAHLRFYPRWAADEMALGRGDRVLHADIVMRAIRNVLGLLAAVNRTPYATESELKGMRRFVNGCALAPDAAADRIDHALAVPNSGTVADLWALVSEVLDLVEVHVMDVDVDVARVRRVLSLPLTPSRPPR